LDKNAKNQPIIISKINLDNPFTRNKNKNFNNANINNLEDKNQKDIKANNNIIS